MDITSINTHDKFFKFLFSKKEEVKDFVKNLMPQNLVNNLNLNTLELCSTEYINKNLKVNFSDIVYNCNYGQNTQVKISLLFEHKSYPESYPHFQLLSYVLNIWQTQIKQKEKLTPVILIIFYHGKQQWKQKNFTEYFENIDDVLQKYLPIFNYELVDTSLLTNEQIHELFTSLELQIGLLVMKNIYDEQKILQDLTEIFANVNELLQTTEGEAFIDAIIAYLYYSTKLETSKISEKMKTISPIVEEKFISTGMRLEMKDREEGKQEGKQEEKEEVVFLMLQKGLSDDLIIDVTKINKKRLEEIKKKLIQ